MAEQKLALEKRTLTGKKLTALRAAGQVPVVIYGDHGVEPILAAAAYNPLEKALRAVGYHSTLELDLAGKTQLAIAKNIDLDPVSRRIINVEFRTVAKDAVIEATTPIEVINFEGSEAHKLHLDYLLVLEEVEVKAKPADLPKSIAVDAAHLAAAGDKLTVADLQLPQGVELANRELDPATAVVSVYDAAAQAAAQEAADKAAAEAEADAAATPAEESSPESNQLAAE